MEDLLANEHLRATLFGTEEHPDEGALRAVRRPARLSVSETPPLRHAPRLNEHGVEVLREAGLDATAIADALG
jgi:crotonobetainyl-CoA:carnitine CoA-transferase CaiB-like acyl-CoA transferase